MWEAMPILYWRVKVNGKWKFQKARAARTDMGLYAVEPPYLKQSESGDESE